MNRNLPERIAPLSFEIEAAPSLPDYISVRRKAGSALCSQRLIELLADEQAEFTAYPADVFDSTTRGRITVPYYLWVPRHIPGTIDLEHCETWTEPETGQRYVIDLALIPEVEAAAPAVFRPDEKVVFLVHERVSERMLRERITGVDFLPLDVIYQQADGPLKVELERRLANEKDDAHLWCEYAHLLLRLHHEERAMTAADRTLALKPDLGAAWQIRGKVLQSTSRYGDAIYAYERAINLDPSGLLLADYASALLDMGRGPEAVEAARHAVDLQGQVPATWFQLGRSFLALESYEAAIEAFERAATILPGWWPEAHWGKGDALAHLGRYEEALAAFDAGLQFTGSNVLLLQGRAAMLRALGLVEEALLAERRLRQVEERRLALQRALPL